MLYISKFFHLFFSLALPTGSFLFSGHHLFLASVAVIFTANVQTLAPICAPMAALVFVSTKSYSDIKVHTDAQIERLKEAAFSNGWLIVFFSFVCLVVSRKLNQFSNWCHLLAHSTGQIHFQRALTLTLLTRVIL